MQAIILHKDTDGRWHVRVTYIGGGTASSPTRGYAKRSRAVQYAASC